MTNPSKRDPTYEELEEDHRRVRELLGKIGDLVETGPGGESAPWVDALGDLLGSLHQQLTTHFQFEEATNLFTELPIEFPRFADVLDRLKAEHPVIVEKVTRTRETLAGAEGSAALAEVGDQVRDLVVALKRHEEEETEILEEAYVDDLGLSE